jgi:hypothetical protein
MVNERFTRKLWSRTDTVIDVQDAIEKFEKLGLQDRAQLLKCNQ